MMFFKNENVKNATRLGVLCAVAYLVCYFARNVLSVVSPYMINKGVYSVEFIGKLSTANMLFYAIGQLVNGIIGDKITAKYMVSGGLVLAGVCDIVISLSDVEYLVLAAYSLIGFFLSMLYAPMVKVIAENTHPKHAYRCCLGLEFAAIFGVPVAGAVSMFFEWNMAFAVAGITLILVGIVSFLLFSVYEKKEIVKYKTNHKEDKKKSAVKILIQHGIIKFTFVSILTGIVRTSVVFWIPTYLSQYLGFTATTATMLFTVMTCAQSAAPYINIMLIYEKLLKRNMNRMLLLMFSLSAVSFIMMRIVAFPIVNIIFLLVAVVSSQGAAQILFSVYCPSLKDTGMVATATGYLDFVSYGAAALANLLFANAVEQIGWGNLILVWAVLMFGGIIISIPYRRFMFKRR
jgi:sugar phosphate permease